MWGLGMIKSKCKGIGFICAFFSPKRSIPDGEQCQPSSPGSEFVAGSFPFSALLSLGAVPGELLLT